jgi:hypothetical protein
MPRPFSLSHPEVMRQIAPTIIVGGVVLVLTALVVVILGS